MPNMTYIHPLLDVDAAVKSVLEVADTPLVAFSRNGDVLLLNWRMQAVTGFPMGQALTQRFLETALSVSEREAILGHVQSILESATDAPIAVQWTFNRKDGSERTVPFSTMTLKDSTGENIGVLYVGRSANRQSAPVQPDPATRTPALRDEDENITSLAFRIEVSTGRIKSMNAASRYLLGYLPEDFEADPKLLTARVLPEYHEAFQDALGDAVRGVARSIEVGFAKRDNSTVILATMLYPSRNRDRQVVAVEGIGRDITARKDMEQQLATSMEELQAAYDRLQAQHDELQSLDRLKSQVLANVSHELRTPLVTIRGYNELMLAHEMGPLTERQRKGLEISAKSIQRLLALIENLIDFARLEKDRYRLPKEKVDVAGLVSDVVADTSDAMRARSIKIGLKLPPEPVLVLGDSARLRQSLHNLLDNAEKFCEAGGVVSVEVTREQGFVVLVISDTGIGIPDSEKDRIFETFYQVDGSTTRQYPGLGIGLAIVKEVIDLHGGRVEVQSTLGKGTAFRVLLPEMLDAGNVAGKGDSRQVQNDGSEEEPTRELSFGSPRGRPPLDPQVRTPETADAGPGGGSPTSTHDPAGNDPEPAKKG